MLYLALAYLRDRALTTLLNVLLLGLAVATLVLLLNGTAQISSRLQRDAAGVDLVVGAKGSPLQLILSSIYQIDSPVGNIPQSSVAILRRDPSVAFVVPLALGDNFRGYRIVGTDRGYFELYGAEIRAGRIFSRSGEAVVGSAVARETGMALGRKFVGSHGLAAGEEADGHSHHPFKAVGILKPTGSVIDRLILVSVATVWDVHGIEHAEPEVAGNDARHGDGHVHDEKHVGHDDRHAVDQRVLQPEITALLVKYRNAYGAVRLPSFVNRQTGMQAAVPAIETARLLGLLGVGVDGAKLFAWLLAAIGGLAIFVTLLQAASAREGDLALLRIMGASRARVFGTILLEGGMTAAAGGVMGMMVGHAVLFAATGSSDRFAEMGLDPWYIHPNEFAVLTAVVAIGVLAALVPAYRVFKTDLATTLARAS